MKEQPRNRYGQFSSKKKVKSYTPGTIDYMQKEKQAEIKPIPSTILSDAIKKELSEALKAYDIEEMIDKSIANVTAFMSYNMLVESLKTLAPEKKITLRIVDNKPKQWKPTDKQKKHIAQIMTNIVEAKKKAKKEGRNRLTRQEVKNAWKKTKGKTIK